ncbi:MAG: MalY/PatB family protein [Muribaculaceae bacterium]
MNKYNFDKIIDRHNTKAIKIDALKELFGKSDLLPLWVADMDFEIYEGIVDAIEKRMSHHIYGYSCPSDGYWQSIIDWQSANNQFCFTKEEITYVPGVVKGLAMAVNFFTEKGDKIVIQSPVYHPFSMVIEGNERIVVKNPLLHNDDDDYAMDFENLENIFCTEKPRMLILCNPHNPIGITWSKDTLARLAHLCKKHEVLVVSDEIHGDLAMFGNHFTPFATASIEAAENSIILGAPSKTFNIPGLVSSWVVVKNAKLRNRFFHWLESNEFNEPTFIATISTEAAYTGGKEWLNAAKKYIEDNIITVEEYCKKNIPGVKAIRPQASFLIWLDCSGLGLNHDELIDLFVNKARLALNDGEMFGCEGKCHMRFNVASPRSVVINALERLASIINK